MADAHGQAGPERAERRDRLEFVKRALIGRPRSGAELEDTLLTKTPRPADLLGGPALLGRVRDGGRTRRADHRFRHSRPSRPADLDRDRRSPGDVVLSYTQTVQAYETSGGAYVVAKENLGTLPSLVAAAALLATTS